MCFTRWTQRLAFATSFPALIEALFNFADTSHNSSEDGCISFCFGQSSRRATDLSSFTLVRGATPFPDNVLVCSTRSTAS